MFTFEHIVAIVQTIGIIGGSSLIGLFIRYFWPILTDKHRLAKERDDEKYRADVAEHAFNLVKSLNEGLALSLEQMTNEMERLRSEVLSMDHKLAIAVRWICDSMRARTSGEPDPQIPSELQDDIDAGLRFGR